MLRLLRLIALMLFGALQGFGSTAIESSCFYRDISPFVNAIIGALVGLGIELLLCQIKLPIRFSLRTLLIATTLVAAALGLIVWAAK
jgi:hypothetical protein